MTCIAKSATQINVHWIKFALVIYISISRASMHTSRPWNTNINTIALLFTCSLGFIGSAPPQSDFQRERETLTMSTARLLWCAQWMVVVLCAEPVMWQPSARQPPCPSSRSKSQYAAVGSTPNEKCRRATVTGCTGLPGLHPSAQESNTLRQVTTRV